MTATLQIRNLTVSLRGTDVLRDLSFDVGPGKVVGLVGESGAGKSMIGRVLAGALPDGFAVTRGTATFAGQDLTALPPAARRALLGGRVTFIPQEPLTALNPLLTIGDQFSEYLGRLSIPRAARRDIILSALEQVDLPNPAQMIARYPFQLSGGQNQRVLIAMAFVSDPALVVADEPTTALDVSTQMSVVSLIRRFNRDSSTGLIFITHDLRLAAHVCDEIVVLYAGEVVERGPSSRVMASPRHPYTRSLRGSIPEMSGPLHRLIPLADSMPGIGAFAAMPGCRFAGRCPVADPTCAARPPAPMELGEGHMVRCTPACLEGAAALTPEPLPPVPEPNGAPILRIEGLSKRFAPRRGLWGQVRDPGVLAVDAADLVVRPGEFVGVVGESGSGKSTLARLIMGLETPSAGRILVGDTDVTQASRAARDTRLQTLQMIFQDPQSALNPRRSVERLITQGLEASGAPDRPARARALMKDTGLSADLARRFPSELSGGQKQRVNIARALCVVPRLLVADEIVSGLDVSVQAQILNLLMRLRDDLGIALVLISHDLGVVRYLCSRVCVMQNGKIVEQGGVSDVFSNPQHAYTRALLAAIPPDDAADTWPPATTKDPAHDAA
jgi:peptide/nickel transport system ATP-binding protein